MFMQSACKLRCMNRPGPRPYGRAHRDARSRLLADDPPCSTPGCANLATVADHQPPIALHEHVNGTGCCVLAPQCADCSARQGALIAQLLRHARRQDAAPIDRVDDLPDEPLLPASSPVWRVPWLDDLLDVPAGSAWPVLMSAPHPDAVGSYGALVEATAAAHDVELRWWQRLALRRLLEHDVDGALCWPEAVLSTPRRCGKSWLLRELMWWRLTDGAGLFGESQTILHTSRTLSTTEDVAGPAMRLADDLAGYHVRRARGDQDIRYGVENVWMLRSENAAYGLGPGLAVCDEAWDFATSTVAEGIQPALMERESPQLLLVSTAHRRSTDLMPTRRKAAIAEVEAPSDRLIIEWSARRTADLLGDAQRASPIWTKARERMIRKALDDARQAVPEPGQPDPVEMFVSQYLNDWGTGRHESGAGEPIVPAGVWAECVTDVDGDVLALAVEDYYGRSWAVAWASSVDGRIVLSGELHADRDALRRLLVDLQPSVVLAGYSIRDDPALRGWVVEGVGRNETPAALAQLRRAVSEGRIAHTGSPVLDEQVASVRVVEAISGLLPVHGKRSDVLRCAAWCVAVLERHDLLGSVGVF
jgi:hypothetical protein